LRVKRILALATMLLVVVGSAHAAAAQSLQDLQAAAVQAVRQAAPGDARVVATAENLDPRLRLPACGGDLQAQAPDLRRTSARVSVLARGDVVGNGDVHPEERDVAQLGYGYMVDAQDLVGRRLRRPLAAGTVVTPGMLAPREVVQRGQQVSLVAQLDDILVRASGVALDAGDRGDLIRVKSLSCQCVVQGRVSAPGIVDTLP